jgi:hypothetical protein
MHALFSQTGIQFEHYPFPPASVYRAGFLPWTAISEVVPGAPPEVRTHAGEVLFISAVQTDELYAATDAAGIPTVRRVDVWDLILTPFLDTVFDAAYHERVLLRLDANGISRAECQQIRERVREPMLSYNALLWDWVHLGLYDLLNAHLSVLSKQAFRTFYWEAMAIALRANREEKG